MILVTIIGFFISFIVQLPPIVLAGSHQEFNQTFDGHHPTLKSTENPIYILLFIGDGMGSEHRKAARWVAFGFNGELSMDKLPIHGWSETSSANHPITDSAAGGTAIATGHKTNNGMIGLSPEYETLKTVLEYAQDQGLSTGLVTTVQISHATPASFAAHVASRSEMNEIALQLLEKEINVLLGGGENQFLSTTETGYFPQPGKRLDGRNLITEAQTKGYTTICTQSELAALDPSTTNYLLGLFGDEEITRPVSPTLAEMTQSAMEVLNNDPDGFFLMVEGGQIDWASHNNDAANAIQDTIDFDQAVAVGLEFMKSKPNSILVVTADHETGGMSLHTESNDDPMEDGPFYSADGIPFYVRWTTNGHTAANVPITAYGQGAHLLNSTVPNTTHFWALTWSIFPHQYLPFINR